MAASRNSGKSRSQRTMNRQVFRRWPRFAGLLALLIILVSVWWSKQDDIASVCQQAGALLATNPNRAVLLLEQVVSVSGTDAPDAYVLWTRALLAAGRHSEALGCFSLMNNPSAADHKMLLLLADEAVASGDPLLARFSLEAISPESVDRPTALQRLISLNQQTGNATAIMPLAQELLILQPDNANSWRVLAQVQESQQELHAAAATFQEVLKRERVTDRRASALRSLLRLQVLLGERTDARISLDELTKIAPLKTTDQINEVLLLKLEGEMEQAWMKIGEVVAQSPTNMLARETRGTLAFSRGENNTARKDFEAVLRVEPLNKQVHYKLAQVLLRMGNTDDARKHLQENRRLTEISADILKLETAAAEGKAEINRLNKLATAYDQIGQKETATRLREAASRLVPVAQ